MEKHNKSKDKDRRRKIFLAKGMCLVMILSMSIILIYSYAIDSIKSVHEDVITRIKIERFDKVYGYVLELQKPAYSEAKNISTEIEKNINNIMDLSQIKTDLDNGNLNLQLHNIFQDAIRGKNLNNINNGKNGIIIASSDKILEDSYYKRVSNRTSRTWKDEIKNSYNSELEKDAINKLIEHTNSIILTECVNNLNKDDDNYKNHTLIKDSSYDTLRDVYLKEGLDGFKNYQVWVPAYITDFGDVFGQEDFVNGIKTKNNKIIVIQEFNIWDQVKNKYPDIYDMDMVEQLEKEFQSDLTLFYLIGLFGAAAIVVVIIYFSNQYNHFIDKYELEDTNENKK